MISNVIHKHKLQQVDFQTLTLSLDSAVLKVAEQDGELTVWVLKGTQESKCTVEFMILGTGQNISVDMNRYEHLDTVLMSSGLVWHVFCTTL